MSTFINNDHVEIPNEQTLDTLQEWIRRTRTAEHWYVNNDHLVVRFSSLLSLAHFEQSYAQGKDKDDWFVKRFYSPNVRIDFSAITSFGPVEARLYPVER